MFAVQSLQQALVSASGTRSVEGISAAQGWGSAEPHLDSGGIRFLRFLLPRRSRVRVLCCGRVLRR